MVYYLATGNTEAVIDYIVEDIGRGLVKLEPPESYTDADME